MRVKKEKLILIPISKSIEKEVENFFTELFKVNPDIKEETLIYSISKDNDLDIKSIINIIQEDFTSEILVFESPFVEKKDSLIDDLVYLYKKHQNLSYTDMSILIGLIIESNNIKDINIIKKIIIDNIRKDKDLINVINGMFKNDLNVSKTGTNVFMHRNTVINKLNIIKQETGLDIQKFKDAVIMYELLK